MPQSETERRFPCPSCGSDLRYLPGSDRMHCDHCGTEQPIEGAGPWSDATRELDFRKAIENELPRAEMEETRVTQCTSCGARFEFEPDVHAAECPFCATPVVAGTGTDRHIKPRALLPFGLDEAAARAAMNHWLGSLWFAPGGLLDYVRAGRRMQGIYVPYWTYDADTRSTYRGKRGTVYTENRAVRVVVNGKAQTRMQPVQKVRWTKVGGRVARFFDDVLVLASQSLPKRFTDALAPWDLAALEPYRPEFLAGFRAEAYTVGLEDGYAEARDIMHAMIVRDVKFDIGGDRQQIDSLETEVGRLTFKHVLLPVWLAAYKYRGQTYRFVVNGRTGAVQGERPWSAVKIATAAILFALVAGAIGYLIALDQGARF